MISLCNPACEERESNHGELQNRAHAYGQERPTGGRGRGKRPHSSRTVLRFSRLISSPAGFSASSLKVCDRSGSVALVIVTRLRECLGFTRPIPDTEIRPASEKGTPPPAPPAPRHYPGAAPCVLRYTAYRDWLAAMNRRLRLGAPKQTLP